MAKYIGSTPFRDLLANSIADDPVIENCAAVLDGVLNSATKAIPDELIFTRLASDCGFINPVPPLAPLQRLANLSGGLSRLPESVLDLLAWQFHVEGYEAAIGIEAKRELIFSSILLHRRRGTPWAVRHALITALRVPARIEQWFEYGGDPYYFRVFLETQAAFANEEWLKSVFRIIMEYKNVRSWLDRVNTFQRIPMNVWRVAGTIKQTTHIRPILYFFTPVTPVLNHRVDPAVASTTSTKVKIIFLPSKPPLGIKTAFGQQVATSTRLRLAS